MSTIQFDQVMESLSKGMESVFTSKTVVGEPTKIDDTIIIPLVDVTFGAGANSSAKDKNANGCGGIGGRISPSAVLILKDGHARLVNIKNQDAITKILDLVPEIMERVGSKKSEVSDEEATKAAFPEK